MNTTVTGIVLTTMPISEYDKRITILTLDRGKINAFAKGVRKPNSAMLAACNPFSFGRFELYEGRSSYNVVHAEISNYFTGITSSLDSTYYGIYFMEMAEYFTQENNDEREILKLVYQSLRALENEKYEKRLVRFIFELKMLVLNGIYPNVFTCQMCHRKETMTFFSVEKAGLLCADCSGRQNGMTLLPSSVYTMQYIITSSVEKLFSFTVSSEVLKELQELMCAYKKRYLPHIFKSEQFLEEV